MKRIRAFILWLIPTRVYALIFLLMGLLGLIFCFFPLVNLLGYESAAGFGIAGGVAAIFLTLHAVRSGLVEAPLAEGRAASPAADFLKMLVRHELLLALPALLLALNGLRVINCAYAVGVGFWLVIPLPAILLGQLLGWGASVLFSGSLRGQIILSISVVLGSVAAVLAQLALQPPITGHQLFLGYFSGSIYDEALSIPASLVWYRGMWLGAAAALIALIEARWRQRVGMTAHWALLVAAIAGLSFSVIWLKRQSFGIEISAEYVQEELSGRLESEHFIIYYPQTRWFIERREELIEDHEFRYAQMRAFFETDPAKDGKLKSYIYADQDQKGRLMGGRRTLVSKLWLHEMHILWQEYGDHRLAHELAHIFSEPFGAGPLGLSMQAGVGVNMGLVEGAATAADWPINQFSPHEASAALRRLNLAPDISGIVGASGFWTQSSGRAYTLVGSFVRYLVDTYGIEKFKRAYPKGRFERAYSKSSDELIAEWEEFVDEITLNEEQIAVAEYLYDRPTIFEKVCARQIGDLMVEASRAAARGEVGELRDIYEEILGYDPENMQYRLGYAHALSDAQQYNEALGQVEGMLEDAPSTVFRAQLLSLRGDLIWRQARANKASSTKEFSEAERAYQQCLALGVPSDNRRLLLVKLAALARGDEAARGWAFEYLLGQNSSDVALYYPMQWYMNEPDDFLAAYLVGRRLWGGRKWSEAREYLRRALAQADEPLLAEEVSWMLAQTYYFLGEWGRAEQYFKELSTSERPEYSARAREWLDRIAWRQGNRIGER